MFFWGKPDNTSNEIPMTPVKVQVVTVSEFIQLYEEKGSDMLSAKLLPPRLGYEDFGRVIIEWKNPVFVPASLDSGVFA